MNEPVGRVRSRNQDRAASAPRLRLSGPSRGRLRPRPEGGRVPRRRMRSRAPLDWSADIRRRRLWRRPTTPPQLHRSQRRASVSVLPRRFSRSRRRHHRAADWAGRRVRIGTVSLRRHSPIVRSSLLSTAWSGRRMRPPPAPEREGLQWHGSSHDEGNAPGGSAPATPAGFNRARFATPSRQARSRRPRRSHPRRRTPIDSP